jgi:ribosome-binding protein aMBF1 (putative translation factor)
MPRTKDFVEIIHRKLAANPELAIEVAEATVNARIAAQIVQAREAAALTQAELAKRAKTSQSVIARIEDADYEGHSTKLLQRIGDAMGLMLNVEYYPKPQYIDRDAATVTIIRNVEWGAQPAEWPKLPELTVTRVALGRPA